MNSDIKIISLPQSRWQEFKAIRLEALEKVSHAFGAKYSDAMLKSDDEWIEIVKNAENEEKDLMLFAEHNGELIGMIGAYFNKSKENYGTANIWGTYVNASFRGQGLGKQLMEALIAKLKTKPDLEEAVLTVNPEQLPAVGLYQKLGFKKSGTGKFILGDGVEHDKLVMELLLKSKS